MPWMMLATWSLPLKNRHQDKKVDANAEAETVAREMTVDKINVSSAAHSQQAVQIIDDALATVDDYRADIGAVQNRLESTIDNLSNINENLTTSQSRIVDVDFAKETAAMSRDQMKMQAGMSVMAQAKSMSQFAVQMLG